MSYKKIAIIIFLDREEIHDILTEIALKYFYNKLVV